MANYLITSPSSNTVGTETSDLFNVQALNGVSLFGTEGNDTVSASDNGIAAGSNARLNLGKGADAIVLTGNTEFNTSQIFAGMGKDTLEIARNLGKASVRGGAGLDTVSFVGVMSASTVNGNDMADKISATINGGTTAGFLGGGAGADKISATFVTGINKFTLKGGLGHDVIDVDAATDDTFSGMIAGGGGGKDTITFNETGSHAIDAGSNINGDDQADSLTFSGAITVASLDGATIGAGAGADTIQFYSDGTTTGGVELTNGFVNLGLGNDSIYISGNFIDGTLNGGAGADTITVVETALSADIAAGQIYGDAGADKFNLGTFAIAQDVSGVVRDSGGAILSYSSFDESNLSATDFASAAFTIAASGYGNVRLLNIQTDVVDMTVANGVGNPTNFTGTNGIATFTSTFSDEVSARMVALDGGLTSGQAIAFSDGNGTPKHYVFVQGGAQSSGIGNDLLVQVSTAAASLNAASVSALNYVVSGSEL